MENPFSKPYSKEGYDSAEKERDLAADNWRGSVESGNVSEEGIKEFGDIYQNAASRLNKLEGKAHTEANELQEKHLNLKEQADSAARALSEFEQNELGMHK